MEISVRYKEKRLPESWDTTMALGFKKNRITERSLDGYGVQNKSYEQNATFNLSDHLTDKHKIMKTQISLSLLLFGLLFSCENAQEDMFVANPELETIEAQAFIAKTNAFALDLFKAVAATEEEENYMVSPVSVSMALGMVHNGTSGATLQAFDAVLGGGNTLEENNTYHGLLMESLSSRTSGTTLDLANAIWIQEGFPVATEFVETNKRYYDSEVANVDFKMASTVDRVNAWALDNTNGKIKDFVEEFDEETRLFLANAIYFKSQWKYRFDRDNTIQRPFYLSETNSIDVPMMNLNAEVLFAVNDQFSAIALPYKEDRFEMVVLLPHFGNTTSTILDALDANGMASLFNENLKSELQISLPRFTSDYGRNLNDVLSAMGLGIAFSEAADFSGINQESTLAISSVFQKTFIEVNEEGTEAAAVTGVEVVVTSAPPSFVADRPFLYIIREKFTGAICFMGRVGNPR